MGKTLSEKILSKKVGKNVYSGDIIVTDVDYVFAHDASGPLTIEQLGALPIQTPKRPKGTIIFIDHAVPSPNKTISNNQALLRKWARETGSIFSEMGQGICHQIMAEDYACPGQIILGTDSHTVTAGALSSFATGMGATDIAVAIALGKTWLRVPETIRIHVDGILKKGVYSKDLILTVIGQIGSEGGTYKSIEFQGKTISGMRIDERMTLTNMSVEAGAKVGLVESDNVTFNYLKNSGRGNSYSRIVSDEDANYEESFYFEADKIEPSIALPDNVDKVKPVSEVEGLEINEVYIGSCTNGRIQDLRIVADMLKGKHINSNVRLIVTPASRGTFVSAMKDGVIELLLQAGAIITPPGCGVCFGALGGVPADDERILTTSNRNFKGRTGNPKAETYLGSPATAAVTALKGRITDPRSEF